MASFKIVYLDIKPMRINKTRCLAGLAVGVGDEIRSGKYYGVLNGLSFVHVLHSGGAVLQKSGSAPASRPIPITLDFEKSYLPDIDEIYSDDGTLVGLNVISSHTAINLPSDQWTRVEATDANGRSVIGWAKSQDQRITLQSVIDDKVALMPPFNIIDLS